MSMAGEVAAAERYRFDGTTPALVIVCREAFKAGYEEGIRAGDYHEGFEEGLKAAPRAVSTVAELDALPVDTVIKAASGAVLHRQRAEFWTPCDDSTDQFYTTGVVAVFRAPFTVLWVGGTE